MRGKWLGINASTPPLTHHVACGIKTRLVKTLSHADKQRVILQAF